MWGWFKRKPKAAAPAPRPVVRLLQAGFDGAQTTDANRRHWAQADDLSAAAAESPHVRRLLRSRTRYEVGNNPYGRGIVSTLANDTIGRVPRLQMHTGDKEIDRKIEQQFAEWARCVRLGKRLRTVRKAKCQDGEAFLLLTTNPKLRCAVKLSLELREADQFATPDLDPLDPRAVDGIRFDEFGNPVEYHLLDAHPGDLTLGTLSYKRIPAEFVIHLHNEDRPGQRRAVPELTPALPTFALQRDHTIAVLGAAKNAAVLSGVLETNSPPNGDADDLVPEDVIEPDLNALTIMPSGWKMNQLKAEQPTTTYAEFKDTSINEEGRCVNMPFNVAKGDSSSYNYASGRLDHQTYFKSNAIEEYDFELEGLDRILDAWFEEAQYIPGYLPEGIELTSATPHQWMWDGNEHVDPVKEATADELDLRNGTTNRHLICAKKGLDWETEVLPKLIEEQRLMKAAGLVSEPQPQPAFAGARGPGDDQDNEDDDEEATRDG